MASINPEVWFALVYGGFLLAVAHVLDLLARRTGAKTTAMSSSGFEYHENHDAWKCQEDQWLWPISFDPDNRVTRYQASPTVCNPCPVKHNCTTSDAGRQLARNIDPWPSSEAERFHRGIACSVVVLGLIWPLASMFQNRTGVELLILGAASALIAAGSWPLWSHLRRTPARFPEHLKVVGLDESVAARAATAAVEVGRRSGYGSIRKTGPRPVRIEPYASDRASEQTGTDPEAAKGHTVSSSFSARWAELDTEDDPGRSGTSKGWSGRGTP